AAELAGSPNRHQPISVRERQRAHQHAINAAEDRRVRPDAQRQRQHGDGGEAGVLEQRANGVAKIVHHKSSKSECRNPKEARNPKTEQVARLPLPSGSESLGFWFSDFIRIWGIRISDFFSPFVIGSAALL